MRVFLAAHRARFLAVGVVQAGFLHHGAAVLDQLDLAAHFVVDGLFQEAERVQVLDLAARAERRVRAPAHRDVGIAAEAAFLHVAVADAQPHHQRVQRAGIRHGFGRAAHVGLGDDLQQRRAGAVQVDAGHAGEVFVQRFAGVFFQVGARQVDGLLVAGLPVPAFHLDGQRAALHHRNLVLADLVALGQIGVEVILAREDALGRDLGPDGQAERDGALDGALVEHRQHAGQRQINRRGLRVGRRAEGGGGAGENLRGGRKLCVRFEADHHFPLHVACVLSIVVV